MERWDVIVAGGGVAGVAAALGAKRAGAQRVLLLERQYLLGGLATCGLIAIYLPICDGRGEKVCTGLAEELLLLSMQNGAEGRYPSAWVDGNDADARKKQRYQVQYNPWLFAIDCEQRLLEEDIAILYGASIIGAQKENGRLKNIEIAHKSGRETLWANAFVDATGDADVFWLAGAPTAENAEGNILASWYYATEDGENKLHWVGFHDQTDGGRQPAGQNAGRRHYRGLDARELTEMSVEAHRVLKDRFLEKGQDSPSHSLSSVALIPQVRMTRRAEGHVVFGDEKPFAHVKTSVGRVTDWRTSGNAFELPFEALQSCELGNLYAAGRCISVTDAMWDITRSIPNCVVSGQAAGVAAALQGEECSVQAIQDELTRQHVVLHFA